ncbi:MAG: NAD(P)H-hydrate dehydratase [Arenimonas sp.]|nr:NAD(P)H-hydrate dehydratase [Arenimonas sp.]
MSLPLPLYTSDQIRAMDALAIESLGLSGYELMGRAGAAAWAVLRHRWPHAKQIVVVCGPGNNGGDGYVLARIAKAAGCKVEVLVDPGGAPRSRDGRRAASDWRGAAGVTRVFDGLLPEADVWVDALYGIGLTRQTSGVVEAMIERINASHQPVLALDVASGLDADRGSALRMCIRADVTLSFIAGKRGLYTGQACDVSGEVLLDRLGLPENLFADFTPAARLYRRENLVDSLGPRHSNAHKGEHGHVLCVGGEMGMGGAVRLCAEAALRAGAGLASVATRSEGVAALVAARPEAMTHAVEDADALQILIKRADVLAVGPGLGRGEWGRTLFEAAVGSGKPIILDADGLGLLAAHPRPLPQAILTPHPGEAARLLGISNEEVQVDRFAAVQALVEKFDCVVVLKGAGTLVAAPGEITAVIGAGNPGMATGGMGDVLTGVIAALRAQRLPLFFAAVFGALLHGAAGDDAARIDGERGLLPSDLFPHLRRLANPE